MIGYLEMDLGRITNMTSASAVGVDPAPYLLHGCNLYTRPGPHACASSGATPINCHHFRTLLHFCPEND